MKHPRSRPAEPTKARPGHRRKSGGGGARQPKTAKVSDALWLWGVHAVRAALANPARPVLALHASKNAARHVPQGIAATPATAQEITALLPEGAVHQGLALRTRPLPLHALEHVLHSQNGQNGVLVMLDGITDPRNFGAILRSAAAFGAQGVIAQTRHMPPQGGVLAKAAAGALERVPLIGVTNLARALAALANAGWFSIGLAGESRMPVSEALRDAGKVCLVLGSEGKGLRPNVARHCDQLARIPIHADMESLNVATAAAIALYEAEKASD